VYLAVDGALHGGVNLLADEAAGQEAPDHVELMKNKSPQICCLIIF
jgi:hypothetical protein